MKPKNQFIQCVRYLVLSRTVCTYQTRVYVLYTHLSTDAQHVPLLSTSTIHTHPYINNTKHLHSLSVQEKNTTSNKFHAVPCHTAPWFITLGISRVGRQCSVCARARVCKAAAIREIDGKGRMETMSCVAVFLFFSSAFYFLSAPSRFSPFLLSSPYLSFPLVLKRKTSIPSPPFSNHPLFLSWLALSFIHLGIQQQSSSQPPWAEEKLHSILTLNENFSHKRH